MSIDNFDNKQLVDFRMTYLSLAVGYYTVVDAMEKLTPELDNALAGLAHSPQDLSFYTLQEYGKAYWLSADYSESLAFDFALNTAWNICVQERIFLDDIIPQNIADEIRRTIGEIIDVIDEYGNKIDTREFRQKLKELQITTTDDYLPVHVWHSFAKELAHILQEQRNICYDWGLSKIQKKQFESYLDACILLSECLKVAQVSNRQFIKQRLLSPPKHD